ncbi:glycosyltransferase, partial [Bacillus sp. JJ634]
MKKNLLFIMPSLSAGGGEKSLVNLLSQIDYDLFNVDLFLLNHEGIFMEFLPKEVRLISNPPSFQLFTLPLARSIKGLLLNGKFSLAYNRMMFTIQNRKIKNSTIREQMTWKYMSRSFDKLEKEYDVAIGFLEKTSTYFCVDKVKAAKKIGWVHTDYDKLGMDPEFDKGYFQELQHIITVSEECANVMKNRFPDQKNKVEVIYNIVSPKMINNLASVKDNDIYNKKENET